jgi:hypothetical protein
MDVERSLRIECGIDFRIRDALLTAEQRVSEYTFLLFNRARDVSALASHMCKPTAPVEFVNAVKYIVAAFTLYYVHNVDAEDLSLLMHSVMECNEYPSHELLVARMLTSCFDYCLDRQVDPVVSQHCASHYDMDLYHEDSIVEFPQFPHLTVELQKMNGIASYIWHELKLATKTLRTVKAPCTFNVDDTHLHIVCENRMAALLMLNLTRGRSARATFNGDARVTVSLPHSVTSGFAVELFQATKQHARRFIKRTYALLRALDSIGMSVKARMTWLLRCGVYGECRETTSNSDVWANVQVHLRQAGGKWAQRWREANYTLLYPFLTTTIRLHSPEAARTLTEVLSAYPMYKATKLGSNAFQVRAWPDQTDACSLVRVLLQHDQLFTFVHPETHAPISLAVPTQVDACPTSCMSDYLLWLALGTTAPPQELPLLLRSRSVTLWPTWVERDVPGVAYWREEVDHNVLLDADPDFAFAVAAAFERFCPEV